MNKEGFPLRAPDLKLLAAKCQGVDPVLSFDHYGTPFPDKKKREPRAMTLAAPVRELLQDG